MDRIVLITLSLALIVFGQANDFYPGRSAQVLLRPNNYEENSAIFLLNRHGESKQIDVVETSVADYISHTLGGPVVNSDIHDSVSKDLPKGNLFDKDVANLFVIVDGVDSEYLQEAIAKKYVKLVQQTTQNGKNGMLGKFSRSGYPRDAVSSIASMVSGSTPSSHGIVGSFWFDSEGAKQVAFRDNGLPSQENVADILALNYEGQSLITCISADVQLAHALCVNQFIKPFGNNSERSNWNAFGYYFDQWNNRMDDIYGEYRVEAMNGGIEELMAISPAMKSFLTAAGIQSSFNEDASELIITLPELSLSATFEVNIPEISTFFVELEMIRKLNEQLTEALIFSNLVNDNIPDMHSIAVSSLKGLKQHYGYPSTQFEVAFLVLDSMISNVMSNLKELYRGKLSVEAVFLGMSAAESMQNNQELREQIFNTYLTQGVDEEIYATSFPAIYVQNPLDKISICANLQSSSSFQVVCAPAFEEISNFGVFRQGTNNTNVTTGDKDAPEYQITLWSSVILGIVLLTIVYTMASMDTGGDTLISRMTSVKKSQ